MDKTYETTRTDSNRNHPVYGNIQTDKFGHKIGDNNHSLRAGRDGPMLMTDTHYLRKMQRFNRERIPPRNVHAKGAGARGYLEITKDITKYCKADVFSEIGKKTPVFMRFSLVRADHGDADVIRDPRGFAIRYYTNEGNWDNVCNNLPVFFVRDGISFPDFIHTQKRCPLDGFYHYDDKFDFWAETPESIHMVLMIFSPRGTPASYRKMHGFAAHTFRMENAKGEVFFVKFHYVSQNGIENHTSEQVKKIAGEDPDYCKRDLMETLQSGKTAEWKACIQVMPEAQAENYDWNILDITKVWPHKDFPLIEYGRLVLNEYTRNDYKETEQSAFCPANMVPGIYPSNDPMLQSRMQSYDDTQLYRLGPLYHQIPVNQPINEVDTYNVNGPMNVTDNNTKKAWAEPNTMGGPREAPQYKECPYKVKADTVDRWGMEWHKNDDFEQPRRLLNKVMSKKDREMTRDNFVEELNFCKKRDVVVRFVKLLSRVDMDFAVDVGSHLKNKVSKKEIEETITPEENVRRRTEAMLQKRQ